MHSARSGVLLVGMALVAVGCEGPSRVTAPEATASSRAGSGGHEIAEWKHGNIPLQVRDQCDPTTFNQAVGPGDCIATPTVTHRVTFQEFLTQIEATHMVRGWFNNPGFLLAGTHSTIEALNTGGEEHTFTRVAKYGGGFVPQLNALAGEKSVANECLSLPPSEILEPGQTDHEVLPNTPGVYHFQCCIHPWMRTDVRVGNH